MVYNQIKNIDLAPLFATKKEVSMEDIDQFLLNNLKIENNKINYLRYRLVKDGMLERTGYKKYSMRNFRQEYIPDLNKQTKEIFSFIKQKKQLLKLCIWRTSILNEFMRHQVGKFMIVVEVERIGIEAVFDILRDNYTNVFLSPTDKELDYYISTITEAIIVIPLVTEAPTQTIGEVETTTIEKLLVDILTEEKLFQAFQSERSRIIQEANAKYIINLNKLLRYARRRRKHEFIEKKITEVVEQEYIEK